MKIKDFVELHGIDKMAEVFQSVALKILEEVPASEWIWMTEEYGDGKNCRTRALEIWAPNEPEKSYQKQFSDFRKRIELIPNCIQVYVIYVEPGSTIPQHKDDDHSLRIVTAVNDLPECWLEIDGNNIVFEKGRSIGLRADLEFHGGENPSDQHWIFFVVCIDSHPFGEQTLILE